MPLLVSISKSRNDMINATSQWQIIDLPYEDEKFFVVKPNSYLIEIKKINR
jgi:hypothetical protein